MLGDIDPAKHAGESWFDVDEYAAPGDVAHAPHVLGDLLGSDEYYPGPAAPRKWPPSRGYRE